MGKNKAVQIYLTLDREACLTKDMLAFINAHHCNITIPKLINSIIDEYYGLVEGMRVDESKVISVDDDEEEEMPEEDDLEEEGLYSPTTTGNHSSWDDNDNDDDDEELSWEDEDCGGDDESSSCTIGVLEELYEKS